MRVRTGEDGGFLPRSYTRGHGVSTEWHDEARCIRPQVPMIAESPRKGGAPSIWLVEPEERYRFAGTVVLGARLLELALGECTLCPAQWECASYAVRVGEEWGIWGMSLDQLMWVKRLPDPERFIRTAQRRHKPIQFAVEHAQARLVSAC